MTSCPPRWSLSNHARAPVSYTPFDVHPRATCGKTTFDRRIFDRTLLTLRQRYNDALEAN